MELSVKLSSEDIEKLKKRILEAIEISEDYGWDESSGDEFPYFSRSLFEYHLEGIFNELKQK